MGGGPACCPDAPVRVHPLRWAGRSVAEKLQDMRKEMTGARGGGGRGWGLLGVLVEGSLGVWEGFVHNSAYLCLELLGCHTFR